jgi:hypothetical protein
VTNCHEWNAKRSGNWLRRFKDRVVDGRSFREAGNHAGVLLWRLAGVTGPAKGPTVQRKVAY